MGGVIPRDLEGRKEYEIAYSLLPDFWGKGYGTELARNMKKFALKNIKSNRFISITDIRNTGSINVAKKNGMKVLFRTTYLGMTVDVYGLDVKRKPH
jgi:RimJ/RimL family protein N-acetyltransferase